MINFINISFFFIQIFQTPTAVLRAKPTSLIKCTESNIKQHFFLELLNLMISGTQYIVIVVENSILCQYDAHHKVVSKQVMVLDILTFFISPFRNI